MKSSELLRMLLQDGWYVVRQTGSHLIMRHPIKMNVVTFPFHGNKEQAKGMALKILKQAGLLNKK